MFWTEERSKIAYTVPYAQQTISLTVSKGSTAEVRRCRRRWPARRPASRSNSYQERWLRGEDKELTAKGGKPIEILTFKTATDVLAALRAGQVETAVLIDQTANEIVRRGLIEITATRARRRADHMMFRNKTVATKVAATLTEMGADGSYDKLFDKFGLTKAPSKTFAIRGPGPQ